MKNGDKSINMFKILMVLNTITFSAPIMWLLLKMYDGDNKDITKITILAVIGILLIIGGWIAYFRYYKNQDYSQDN